MNSPTTSVPEDIDKALDNLIDWIMGHDDEELTNIDFRKAKREVLTTVESYGDRRELEGRHKFITKAADAAFKQYDKLAEEESSIKAKLESQKENL
jgi:hypothetical protein